MTNENKCSGCRVNCCESFLIAQALVDENWWEREGQFMFDFLEKDYYTGRFSCKIFDREKKICTNYDERPNFCRNTGENGNWPSEKCLLKKREMARV